MVIDLSSSAFHQDTVDARKVVRRRASQPRKPWCRLRAQAPHSAPAPTQSDAAGCSDEVLQIVRQRNAHSGLARLVDLRSLHQVRATDAFSSVRPLFSPRLSHARLSHPAQPQRTDLLHVSGGLLQIETFSNDGIALHRCRDNLDRRAVLRSRPSVSAC